MYRQHFGLREPPFGLTPDTGYFLNRAGYQDALNVLLVALRAGEGFVKVTGEVGTGKTLLCRKLLNSLGEGFATAYLHNPYLEPAALLQAVAEELGVEVPAGAGPHALVKALDRALLAIHAAGRRVVVCLDEAQAMPLATLESLRLLTNLETERRKLVQVVLFGQPELDRLLAEPSVRQLRQRITFSYQLLPMNRPELAAYVGHRLAVAGHAGEPLFSRPALDLLYRASRGVPRLANILCHKSLMLAYGRGGRRVECAEVRLAARDTLDAQGGVWWERLPRPLLRAGGVLALFALGLFGGALA
jgi:MSHA biogenesis protein MshM